MVRVLAIYFDDLSSKPVEVYNFSVKIVEKNKNKQKRGRDWQIFKHNKLELCSLTYILQL